MCERVYLREATAHGFRVFLLKLSVMKAVLQRVSHASVEINNAIVGQIERGLVLFLGVEKGDTERDDPSHCDRKIRN